MRSSRTSRRRRRCSASTPRTSRSRKPPSKSNCLDGMERGATSAGPALSAGFVASVCSRITAT
eukprot:11437432-Alexandrium_andersonii.AAC.1